MATATATAKTTFTMEEVGKHRTEKDCWMVIGGKVLDITDFLTKHPGGEDILLDGAGKDQTDEFEDTGHSSDARKQLLQYAVGEVEGYEEKAAAAKRSSSATATVGPTPAVLMAILFVVLAALYFLVMK